MKTPGFNPGVFSFRPEIAGIGAKQITSTTTLAPDENNFADYILILLVSDIPPIYIYLSKNPDDPI